MEGLSCFFIVVPLVTFGKNRRYGRDIAHDALLLDPFYGVQGKSS